MFGFRARASRISNLASGRGGPRYCGGQPSGFKNELYSPTGTRGPGRQSSVDHLGSRSRRPPPPLPLPLPLPVTSSPPPRKRPTAFRKRKRRARAPTPTGHGRRQEAVSIFTGFRHVQRPAANNQQANASARQKPRRETQRQRRTELPKGPCSKENEDHGTRFQVTKFNGKSSELCPCVRRVSSRGHVLIFKRPNYG
jgi:hypothetical protein